MAGVSEVSGNEFSCPCSTGNTQNDTLQPFIGNNYFCESSNPTHKIHYGMVKVVVLLSKLNCCSYIPGLPWFNKVLNSTTTDYIELRVCAELLMNLHKKKIFIFMKFM